MCEVCRHSSLKVTGQEQLGCITCADCGEVLLAEEMATHYFSQLNICLDAMRAFHARGAR